MPGWSRRRVLMVGAGIAVLTACRREPAPAEPAATVPPVEQRIGDLEERHDGYIGLYGVDLASGRTVAHRDADPFAMCSTFKTYAVARVLQLAQRGALTLDDTVYVDPAAVVSYSPVTGPQAGKKMMLSQVCQAALQRSDNTAGNLLLKTIGGPQAVTEFARSIGDQATRLDRWETQLNSAMPGDLRDTSTPRALGSGYQRLLTGDVLDEPGRRQLESWMRGNVTSARSMRAGLPEDWTSADKTGAGDFGSTNDVGIAFGPDGRRVLLSVMTRSRTQNPNAPMLQPLIADVTALVLPVLTQP